MKRFLLVLSVIFAMSAYAVNNLSVVTPVVTPVAPNAEQLKIPIGNGNSVSLLQLSKMSVKEYEQLSGKKMNFFNRLSFKATQRKLAGSIDADGKITDKKMLKALGSSSGSDGGFHLGGFLLGLFVGLIGVLIAYLIKDEKKRSRVKWAWIGFAIWIAIYLIFFL
jgi:hypothetical protein